MEAFHGLTGFGHLGDLIGSDLDAAAALGATTLGVGQGVLFLLLAPLAGIRLGGAMFVGSIAAATLVAFGLTNVGLMIAWRMESTQGFHSYNFV